jgi:hypothetical protein
MRSCNAPPSLQGPRQAKPKPLGSGPAAVLAPDPISILASATALLSTGDACTRTQIEALAAQYLGTAAPALNRGANCECHELNQALLVCSQPFSSLSYMPK